MKQQIKEFLLEVAQICWLLIKGLLQLLLKGIRYVYNHRIQIIRHKVTLPVLILLSVFWTGFSSFRHINEKDRTSPAERVAPVQEEKLIAAPVSYAKDNPYQLNGGNTNEADANEEEPFKNTNLVAHIMDWVGTPHKDNRQTKQGTDCSGFVQAVFQAAHGIELSRSSKAMYEQDIYKIRKSELTEGDLVFFNTYGNDISHVGIYLKDGKFAHTSTSKGVTVSSLQDKYYYKHYRGAGRIKELVN